ncbi:DNase I-like protein [Auricularia subglabra TFB-10046 SS5]|nr:DNase I-like protein [Auricularia subglabra TFB-10046 SS5]
MSTMSDSQLLSLVRPLLRPTEAAVVAAQGIVPANALNDEQAADAEDSEQDRRRVLAIVTSSGSAGTEEGSIFVYKRKESGELAVASILPITHDLIVSVAQVAASDADGDKRQSRIGKGPGRFLLTLQSPSREREIVLLSSSPSLKDVLAECRRLRTNAETELSSQAPWNKTHHLTTSHAWVEYYEHQLLNYSLSAFGGGEDSSSEGEEHGIPDHLFHPQSLHVPLAKRLSPASAGLPPTEDDATADLVLLRDEWIRKHLNSEREKSAPGSSVINLRICSYNVNGQTPPTVEDAKRALGSWIRTQRPGQVRAGTLPPSPQPETAPSETSSITAVSVESAETLVTPAPHPALRSATLPSPSKLADEPAAIPDIVRTDSPGAAEPHSSQDEPDILVVGFQELDLSAEALLYSTNPAKEDAWTAAILESLGTRSDGDAYIKVASKQLVGMLIIMFSTKAARLRIRDIRTSSAGVGIMGLMGNKGAVALRVRVDGSTLTFVNAHLAAFDEMHEKRNADWREIARKLVFLPSDISDVAPASVAQPVFIPPTPAAGAHGVPELQTVDSTPAVEGENPMFEVKAVAASAVTGDVPTVEHLRLLEKATIWDCDCIFWSVNLNYRIDLPDQDVRELLGDVYHPTDKHNLKLLLRWDQLKASQRGAKAFDGFEEAEIRFLPTYRFDFGIKADQNGYDIKRKPAWTDRILRLQSDAVKVTQLTYAAHPELLLSDHKPVSASFEVETDSMTAAARDALLDTLLRRIGNWILSDDRPRVKLSAQNINFGDVTYDLPSSQTFEIKNVGKAPCGFRFVPPSEDAAICENWLSIEPQWGIILPGESAAIRLTVHVTAGNAAPLNSGKRRLEDTLVIHTLRGKDHFVAIGGNYKSTCFANDLQWLARLPCAVRDYTGNKEGQELLPERQASNAPNEVMRLVAWLMSNGLEKEELFLAPGDHETFRLVHEALDTGASFEDQVTEKDAQSVADVLLALFDSLPEPVMPWSLQPRCTQVFTRDDAFELLGELPAVNRNVWVSLCAFLHFLVQHTGVADAVKHRRTRALAAVFAPILMRDNLDTTAVSPVGKRAFLMYFIEG